MESFISSKLKVIVISSCRFSPQLIRPRGRGRTAAGSRAAGGRNYLFPGYHTGVRPFYVPGYDDYAKKRTSEDHLYDILPGMELTPTNPVTLKPTKTSTQVRGTQAHIH